RGDLAIVAVHGPQSLALTQTVLGDLGAAPGLIEACESLGYFRAREEQDWMLARTGYTGEKGLELLLPAERAPALWDALRARDLHPVGPGARDSLRREACEHLYGHAPDEGRA